MNQSNKNLGEEESGSDIDNLSSEDIKSIVKSEKGLFKQNN